MDHNENYNVLFIDILEACLKQRPLVPDTVISKSLG